MPIGLDIGIGPSSLFIPVTSSPDGVLTMPRGTIATNVNTGVTWKNRNGGTRWDPIDIPMLQGSQFEWDFVDYSPFGTGQGGGGAIGNYPLMSGARAGQYYTRCGAASDFAIIRGGGAAGELIGGGAMVLRATCLTTQVSDGTNNETYRVGYGNATTGFDHTNGAYFENSLAAHGNTHWWLCTASNSVRTKIDTGVSNVANVFQNFEIRVAADGSSVSGEIDGVAVGTISTNIPTAVGREVSFSFYHVKDLGSAQVYWVIDWMSDYVVLTTPRS